MSTLRLASVASSFSGVQVAVAQPLSVAPRVHVTVSGASAARGADGCADWTGKSWLA